SLRARKRRSAQKRPRSIRNMSTAARRGRISPASFSSCGSKICAGAARAAERYSFLTILFRFGAAEIPLRDSFTGNPLFPGPVNFSSRLFGEEEFSLQFKASFARLRYKTRQERGQKISRHHTGQ